MDDFGDNFAQPEADPAADFLAREQNQLAGLEDELEPIPPPQPQTTNNVIEGFVDPIAYNDFDNDILSGEDTGYAKNESVFDKPEKQEPEKIRIWREEQKKRLEEKDAEEEKRKEEMRLAAKKELEDWYTNHEEQISKTKAANRSAERALASQNTNGAGAAGGEWERIASLCEFGPRAARGRDTSRLRGLLLQLKQAGGVRPAQTAGA